MSNTASAAGIATLSGIVLDCSNTLQLAAFYSAITGWPVTLQSDADWATVETPFGVGLSFQRVDEYVAPKWPTTAPPQQFHLDFDVSDLDTAEAQAVSSGATRAEIQPGETFRVFFDPESHPFCLCTG